MALLFECIGKCCRNMLDTADIVRDAWYKISVGPSLTVTFARMSKSCRFWTSTKLRVFSSAPITRKSLCFDFGRTDRLYVFYEFDSCGSLWHTADGPLCQAAVRYCAVHGRERIFGLYGRASFGL